MRIGIDARFWHSMHAGMSQYTKGLVKGLAKIDRTNDYYIILRKQDLAEWDVGAPNFHPVVIDITHYSFSEQLILPWKLLALNLDLVHFANFNFPLLYPKRFTVTIHDLAYFVFPGMRLKGRIFKWGYYLTMWAAVRRASKVIAVTKYTRDEVKRRIGGDLRKVSVVLEGVDPSRFPQRTRNAHALRERLGIKHPTLFYVGNWRIHKNLPTLLEGFRILREQGQNVQLVLGGRKSDEISALIEAHPFKKDIVVAGFISNEELPDYYALANVFVYPSLYEGFGLQILEAQYMGVPVAASNTTTLPEVGGKGAAYFNPLDANDLALVVSSILHNKTKQNDLVAKGFKNLSRFSWERAAEETLHIFQTVGKRK